MKVGLPLMGMVIQPLAESVLIPLRLTAVWAADARIHNNVLDPGANTIMIWMNISKIL